MSAREAFQFVHPLTAEDYLTGEREADHRHEFFNGEVYAMAGASKNHERVSMNLASAIHSHLSGHPCEVFKSDMKVRIKFGENEAFYYPDIVVGCDPDEPDDHYLDSPKLIVEILSNDEKRDRLEKFLVYQQLTTLEEYVVIGQNPKKPEVTIHRRSDSWKPEKHTEGSFTLKSIDLTLDVVAIYPPRQ